MKHLPNQMAAIQLATRAYRGGTSAVTRQPGLMKPCLDLHGNLTLRQPAVVGRLVVLDISSRNHIAVRHVALVTKAAVTFKEVRAGLPGHNTSVFEHGATQNNGALAGDIRVVTLRDLSIGVRK